MINYSRKPKIYHDGLEFICDDNADITQYPPIDTTHIIENRKYQLTIGDLHGNFLKLIYFLIRHNVLEVSEKDYELLVAIYNVFCEKKNSKSEDEEFGAVTTVGKDQFDAKKYQENIQKFKEILQRIKVKNRPLIKLIGDEVADRGANDYLTFKIFEKLGMEKVPLDIKASNHGLDFLSAYESYLKNKRNLDYLDTTLPIREQGRSLTQLQTLLKEGIITCEEIENIVDNYYLPNLKLLGYTLGKNSITFDRHAFVGLEAIKWLADYYQIKYSDEHKEDLALTIDRINKKFSQQVKKHQATQDLQKINEDPAITKKHPLFYLTWYRKNFSDTPPQNKEKKEEKLKDKYPFEIPFEHKGYQIYYLNGHDKYGAVPEWCKHYVINLDNIFGLSDEMIKRAQGRSPNCVNYSAVYSTGFSTGYVLDNLIEELNSVIEQYPKPTLKSSQVSFWMEDEKPLLQRFDDQINVINEIAKLIKEEKKEKKWEDKELKLLARDPLCSILLKHKNNLPEAISEPILARKDEIQKNKEYKDNRGIQNSFNGMTEETNESTLEFDLTKLKERNENEKKKLQERLLSSYMEDSDLCYKGLVKLKNTLNEGGQVGFQADEIHALQQSKFQDVLLDYKVFLPDEVIKQIFPINSSACTIS